MSMFFPSLSPSENVNLCKRCPNDLPDWSTSKMMQDLSVEEDISSLLFGEKSTQFTGSQCPSSVTRALSSPAPSAYLNPLVGSSLNILTQQSSPPVAIKVLSDENLQQLTDASSPFLKSAWNSISLISYLWNLKNTSSLTHCWCQFWILWASQTHRQPRHSFPNSQVQSNLRLPSLFSQCAQASSVSSR